MCPDELNFIIRIINKTFLGCIQNKITSLYVAYFIWTPFQNILQLNYIRPWTVHGYYVRYVIEACKYIDLWLN